MVYNTLKLVHVLAVILWFGGGLMFTIAAARARRAGPQTLAAVAGTSAQLGRVFGAAGGVAFLAGVGMMFTDSPWEWESLWITIGIVVFFVSSFLGGRMIGPGYERVAAAAGTGDASAIDAAMGKVRPFVMADLTLLTVAVAAMVYKWTL